MGSDSGLRFVAAGALFLFFFASKIRAAKASAKKRTVLIALMRKDQWGYELLVPLFLGGTTAAFAFALAFTTTLIAFFFFIMSDT